MEKSIILSLQVKQFQETANRLRAQYAGDQAMLARVGGSDWRIQQTNSASSHW